MAINPFWENISDDYPLRGPANQPRPEMPRYGYDYGHPFGDPNKFTRSTREDEINRFNQWMRVQPWYQDYMREQGLLNRGPNQGFSNAQQRDVEGLLRQQGINLPGAFHVDPGGNINQHNRLARNVAIAAAAGVGGYYALPALLGAGGAGAAGAGSVLPSTAAGFTGAGFAAPVASGLGTGLGASVLPSTAAAFTGAGFAPTITSGLSSTLPSTAAGFTGTKFASPVKSALEGPTWGQRAADITRGISRFSPRNQPQQQQQMSQLQQPQQQIPPINIPFSLQTPIFNQGLQGFGGFNVR